MIGIAPVPGFYVVITRQKKNPHSNCCDETVTSNTVEIGGAIIDSKLDFNSPSGLPVP